VSQPHEDASSTGAAKFPENAHNFLLLAVTICTVHAGDTYLAAVVILRTRFAAKEINRFCGDRFIMVDYA